MASSGGIFIVLDGPEGCGKSTQAKRLAQRLEAAGRPVLAVRDPGTTRIGEKIRAILLDPLHDEMAMRCEMLLYMAARAQMMSQVIAPALAQGKVVLSDRFVSSTLAYQLGGDRLTANEIRTVADIAIGSRWPDLILIFDMPIEASMARLQREKDRIEQRPLDYHEQVRRNYVSQAQAMPDRYRIIDAAGSVEQVEERVWSEVRRVIGGG